MRLPKLPPLAWAALAVGSVVLAGAGTAMAATSSGPNKPPGAPPVLKSGSVGAWVSYLQARLGMSPSGTFDALTFTKVKAYQSGKGLGSDGIVGPATWKSLGVTGGSLSAKAAGAASSTYATSSANPGASGSGSGLSNMQAERESQILEAFSAGHGIAEWASVESTFNGHTAKVICSRRALAINLGDGPIIFSLSFRETQKLADMLGCIMMTTKVSDLIWAQADERTGIINHNAWVSDGSMAFTNRMLEQSQILQQKVGGSSGLVANEGKDWVLTKRFWLPPQGTGVEKPENQTGSRHNAANFGWYPGGSKSPGGVGVIQSVGLAHGKNHVDYSQLVRFIQPTVIVDGSPRLAGEILRDPELCGLLSDEGPLPGTRHPDL